MPAEIDEIQPEPAGRPASVPQALNLSQLADELLLPVDFLDEIAWLLDDRSAVIFTGPPGSGKTFLARALSNFYSAGRDVFLQFHPSYAYEDFIEGFRPKTDSVGALIYDIVPGPLRDLAGKANEALKEAETNGSADGALKYSIVIDEINRANLSKVFGELFFALEYRDQSVTLQYSREQFVLPSNLLVFGTMNTADRSIASLDSALRRRFHFVQCDPTKPPFDGLLSRYLTRQGLSNMMWLAALLREANSRIPDTAYAIGPSYFMRTGISQTNAERIWRHSVWPYLTSRFDADSIANLRWESLFAAANVPTPHVDVQPFPSVPSADDDSTVGAETETRG
jgi:5-methylcytosine-specific restriction protein B